MNKLSLLWQRIQHSLSHPIEENVKTMEKHAQEAHHAVKNTCMGLNPLRDLVDRVSREGANK